MDQGTEGIRFHALLRLDGPGLDRHLAGLIAHAETRCRQARSWSRAARREREGVLWCCERLAEAATGDRLYWVAPGLDVYRAHGLWSLFLTRFPLGFQGRLELRRSASPATVPGARSLYEILLTRELLRGAAWPMRLCPDGRYETERPDAVGRR